MGDRFHASEPILFAESLTNDFDLWRSSLIGVYLHGSACLGGWNAASSDVDMLIVAVDGIDRDVLESISRVVIEHARRGPGKGIECSIVTRSQAGAIRDRWPYLAHITSPDDAIPDIFPSPEHNDPDLLMHYAVCRKAGIAISGPPAAEVFAPVSRDVVLAYLAEELIWGLEHAPSQYALLNACRAREFLEHNRIVSKVDAGDEALHQRRVGDPLIEIDAALATQRGGTGLSAFSDEATAFVQNLSRQIRDAVERSTRCGNTPP